MPFKIVRNDITRMHTEAIVNTANDQPAVGTGCDHAVYKAAGRRKLLAYRKKIHRPCSGRGSLHDSRLPASRQIYHPCGKPSVL